VKLKHIASSKGKYEEKAKTLIGKVDSLHKAITTTDDKRVALAEEIASLKSDSLVRY
jgi:chorismate mutase